MKNTPMSIHFAISLGRFAFLYAKFLAPLSRFASYSYVCRVEGVGCCLKCGIGYPYTLFECAPSAEVFMDGWLRATFGRFGWPS